MVRKTLLKDLFYKVVPVCALSTATILALTQSVSAKSWEDIVMQPKGILLQHNMFGSVSDTVNSWVQVGDYALKGINWLINIKENLPILSANICSSIYHLLSNIVLQTPTFIFDNMAIQDKLLTFSGVSVLLVTLMTAYTGIKRMSRKRHTDLKQISFRYFMACTLSGFAPFIFKAAFSGLNVLSTTLNGLVADEIKSSVITGSTAINWLDTVMMFGFDIVSIWFLIPILIKSGKRWFDLLCLSALTPLALASYVFDETHKYFNLWINGITSRAQVQVIYAFFLFIMGVVILGTVGVTSFAGFFIRALIMLGGLMTIANAESIPGIGGMLSQGRTKGDSIPDYAKKIKGTTKKIHRDLTNYATYFPNKFTLMKTAFKKFTGKK